MRNKRIQRAFSRARARSHFGRVPRQHNRPVERQLRVASPDAGGR